MICQPVFAYDMERGLKDSAKGVYADAYDHFEKSDYRGALELIESYLDGGGEDNGLLCLLAGNSHLKENDLEHAYGWYLKSAELYGDNPDIYKTAGSIAYQLKKGGESERCLSKAVQLGLQDDSVSRMLADIYVKQDRLAEAETALKAVRDRNEKDNKLMLYIYAKNGKIRNARHMLHHLVDNTRSDWWKLYGMYVMENDPKEAAAAFRVYIKTSDVQPDEMRMISGLLAKQKVYDEAYEIMDRIGVEKTCSDYSTQGRMGYKLGRFDETRDVLEKSMEKGCMKESGLTLAYVYYRKGEYGRAADMFEKFSNRPKMVYMAALSRYKNGEYSSAETLLRSLPGNSKLKNKVSKLYKLIGDKNDN